MLHDAVQPADALFRLSQFTVAVTHQAGEFFLVLPGDQFHELALMRPGICCDAL